MANQKYPWITLKQRTLFGHHLEVNRLIQEYEEDLEKDLIEVLKQERIAEVYDEYGQEFLDDDTLEEIEKIKTIIHQE